MDRTDSAEWLCVFSFILVILSFLKHVLMILIATRDEPVQTNSDRFHIRHVKQDSMEDSDM